MTEPKPQRPAREFVSIEEVFAALRTEGHRVTTPCRLVLEALFAAEGPISAQQIADASPVAGFEPSSVVPQPRAAGEPGGRSGTSISATARASTCWSAPASSEYLLCERCGRVKSVDPSELDPVREQIERRFGYRARFGHFPIVGALRPLRKRKARLIAAIEAHRKSPFQGGYVTKLGRTHVGVAKDRHRG